MIRTQCKVREQSHPDHTEHGTRSHIAAGYRLWEYLPDIRNIWKSQISDGTLRSQFEKLLKGLGCCPTRKSEILYRGYLDALLAKYDSSSKAKMRWGYLHALLAKYDWSSKANRAVGTLMHRLLQMFWHLSKQCKTHNPGKETHAIHKRRNASESHSKLAADIS